MPTIPKHFGIKNTRAHRALSDVHATTELLKNYIRVAKEKELDIKSFLE